LHDGGPRHELTALRQTVEDRDRVDAVVDATEVTLALLNHPSIASKEATVRTYDHEIMGGTIVRPFGGPRGDGAADGAATIPPGTSGTQAMAIGIGVNAVMGRHDAYAMAWHVVDEAVRNAVVAGADPGELSLLDNFAWGDPTDPETLGQLVAACQACHDAALAFGAPFVSGKDSLYNVFVHPDGTADPVAPTLVITAVGIARAPENIPLTGLVSAGNAVFLVGPGEGELRGSHYDLVRGRDDGGAVPQPDRDAVGRHVEVAAAIVEGLIASAHDISEGGVAVAGCEWAFAGRLGLDLEVGDTTGALFGEGAGRYLVEVAPGDQARFAQVVPSATVVGRVTAEPLVRMGSIELTLDQIEQAWSS